MKGYPRTKILQDKKRELEDGSIMLMDILVVQKDGLSEFICEI